MGIQGVEMMTPDNMHDLLEDIIQGSDNNLNHEQLKLLLKVCARQIKQQFGSDNDWVKNMADSQHLNETSNGTFDLVNQEGDRSSKQIVEPHQIQNINGLENL